MVRVCKFWYDLTWYELTTVVRVDSGDTKQSRLESAGEITQNKHVKVLYCITL
jgi:hypothetical protein